MSGSKPTTPLPTSRNITPQTSRPSTPTRRPSAPTQSPINQLRPRASGNFAAPTTRRPPRTPAPALAHSRPSTPTQYPINPLKPRGHLATTATAWRFPPTTFPTPSTSTSTGSRSPTRNPSICVHSDLTYLSGSVNHPIRPGARYNCLCSPHTLRRRISQLSFRYTDGEGGMTSYAEAPAKAHWCYCSDGEGHVVCSAVEAVERYFDGEREKERSFIGHVDEHGSGRVERLSEVQMEVETVEWEATEKALKEQRDFLWFREVVRKFTRLRCVWLCKRGEIG